MRYVKCELHTHTLWSDGTMTPEELVENAVRRGYRAIASTDHNTWFAYPRIKAAADRAGLVAVKGIEWTTFYGHLTVLGGNSPVDWRDVGPTNIDEKILEARASGDAVVLCHPARIGGQICCGCHNDFDIAAGVLSGMEVWSRYNQNRDAANAEAERLWRERLDNGERIAAVYGYDWHRPDKGCPSYSATYVGVDGEVTPEKIVEGVKRGHTYVSSGVVLDVKVSAGGAARETGDAIPAGAVEAEVTATVDDVYAKEYDVEIEEISVEGSAFSARARDNRLSVAATAEKGYFFFKVFGRINGERTELAITSPYYAEEL